MNQRILRIAIPSPLRRSFDYLLPATMANHTFEPGVRVRVPFGPRELVGVLLEEVAESPVPVVRLKPIIEILDETSLLPGDVLELLRRACSYYRHAPGDVYIAALPALLRQGQEASVRGVQHFRLTDSGQAVTAEMIKRAPRQWLLLKLLGEFAEGMGSDALNSRMDNWRAIMKRLLERQWVKESNEIVAAVPEKDALPSPPVLNGEQQVAVTAVVEALGGFQGFLLEGITGSGKTEVYLRIIEEVLATGRQALVLVPEIGLTPQLVQRFQQRFPVPIALLHSGLNDTERLNAWLMARDGSASIVIGTRSAVFTPLAKPGVIIVDEEHDASYKQQDGFRYSARDLAVMRAHLAGVPVLLGTATPSMESLHNAQCGRYQLLELSERAGVASEPSIRLLDLRSQPMDEGLSDNLLQVMRRHLKQDGQILLFLNRRGYAPVLMCHDCGWVGKCQRCDAHLTLYAGQRRMRCHHCASERPVFSECPECKSKELHPVGQGTERVEQALQRNFPDIEIARIDRDSTRRKGSMEAMLERIHDGQTRILVGTQMLAKGHHFPGVTLVAILDCDQGLFSVDFRASERMAQLITQVAGRAGRAEKPGEVLIQTHHPEHPLLQRLIEQGYQGFCKAVLAERQDAELPPYSHMALLRAEAVGADAAMTFLQQARDAAHALGMSQVEILGPVPAPMERRAGRFRAQLLLQAMQRQDLQNLLSPWVQQLEGLKAGRKVRWSLDVDPYEMY